MTLKAIPNYKLINNNLTKAAKLLSQHMAKLRHRCLLPLVTETELWSAGVRSGEIEVKWGGGRPDRNNRLPILTGSEGKPGRMGA